MADASSTGSTVIFLVSVALSLVVLGYRLERLPALRRGVDRLRERLTGEPDWSWLRLWHVLLPLVVVTAINVGWNVAYVHCSDDSLAILASGQAALHGHDPFLVNYCSGATPDQIPYGTAEVALNALAAVSGSVAAVWLLWQLLALAVVPLVWYVGGSDRRYLSVLAATSVTYLPNIATNIGVENAIVPVSILVMLLALRSPGSRRPALTALAAFLSTARFPAAFPVLGATAGAPRDRLRLAALVVGVFAGSVLLGYALWGWNAIHIVYLNQFSRVPGESLNVFALLLHERWVAPSLAVAAVQGGGILLLVLWVHVRRYSPAAAAALPILGVMSLTQYLTFHFVVWLVPLVLLGARVNRGLFLYATLTWVDETIFSWNLGAVHGLWGPYEVTGVLLSLLLAYLIVRIVLDEEARRSGRAPAGSAGERSDLPGLEPAAANRAVPASNGVGRDGVEPSTSAL